MVKTYDGSATLCRKILHELQCQALSAVHVVYVYGITYKGMQNVCTLYNVHRYSRLHTLTDLRNGSPPLPPLNGMLLSPYLCMYIAGLIYNACQLELASILMLENVNKLQNVEACLHFIYITKMPA